LKGKSSGKLGNKMFSRLPSVLYVYRMLERIYFIREKGRKRVSILERKNLRGEERTAKSRKGLIRKEGRIFERTLPSTLSPSRYGTSPSFSPSI
jgi:hypothetical protein